MSLATGGLQDAYGLAVYPLLVLAVDVLVGRTANFAAGIAVQVLTFVLVAHWLAFAPLPLALMGGVLAALIVACPTVAIRASQPLQSAAAWLVVFLVVQKLLSVTAPSGVSSESGRYALSSSSLAALAIATLLAAWILHAYLLGSDLLLRIEAASWGPQWYSRYLGSVLGPRMVGLSMATLFSGAASFFQLASMPTVKADEPWLSLSLETLLLYFLARKGCEAFRLNGRAYSATLLISSLGYSLVRDWFAPKFFQRFLSAVPPERAAASIALALAGAATIVALSPGKRFTLRPPAPRLSAHGRAPDRDPARLVIDALRLPRGVTSSLSAEMDSGVLHILRGPNGVGKSTLLQCLSGHQRAAGGSAYLAIGRGREPLTWVDRSKRLPGSAFLLLQESALVPPMPCSLLASLIPGVAPGDHSSSPASELSRGGLRIEELGLVFAREDSPRILLLDEPCAGLADDVAKTVIDRLVTLAGSGLVVVASEHDGVRGGRATASASDIQEWLLRADGLHKVSASLAGSTACTTRAGGQPAPLLNRGAAPFIKIEDARVRYRNTEGVLYVPHFEARIGKFHVIRGPNGTGKSSLLGALAGFRAQISGTVTMGSIGWTPKIPTWELRRRGVYFLPSNMDAFIPGCSVRQHLALVGAPRDHDRWLALAEVPGRVTPWELSGGQRRWLGLVLATGFAARRGGGILLLDEPFSGLSPRLFTEAIRHLETLSSVLVILVDHEHEWNGIQSEVALWHSTRDLDGIATLRPVAT